MFMPDDTPKKSADGRRDRLAQELRANLKRRKSKVRDAQLQKKDASKESEPDRHR